MIDRRTLLAAAPALLAWPPGQARAAADTTSLVLGMGQEPRHFNGAIQSGTATAVPGTQIFASPLRFDADWNPLPYLAKSWEVAADALSVTLHLVETAVFHDGHPVTSEDVAFSIGIIKARHPFTTMLAPVDAVDTPDPHTVVIRLKHPHPALLLSMSPALMPILPKHIYGDGQDIMTHPANLKPIGSGPFRFVEYVRGQYIRLERFDRFFLPNRPMLDSIVIRIVTDPTIMVLGLERQEVHLVPLLAGTRNIDRAQRLPNTTVTDKGYAGIGPINWLAFNCARKPFDDPKVRKAIAYAVDRKTITRVLMGGKAAEAIGPIVPSSPFFNKDLEPYPTSVEKANALLDEAGHKRGADGTRFPMVIDYDPGDPEQGAQRRRVPAPGSSARSASPPRCGRCRISRPGRSGSSNYDYDADGGRACSTGAIPVIGVARTYLSAATSARAWSGPTCRATATPEGGRAAGTRPPSEPDPARRHGTLCHEFQAYRGGRGADPLPERRPLLHCGATRAWPDLPLSIWGAMSPLHELRWADPAGVRLACWPWACASLNAALLLLAVVVLNFLLVHLAPGDPGAGDRRRDGRRLAGVARRRSAPPTGWICRIPVQLGRYVLRAAQWRSRLFLLLQPARAPN